MLNSGVIDMLSADQGSTYGFRQEAWRPSLASLLPNKVAKSYWIKEVSKWERELFSTKGTQRYTEL